MKKLGYLLEKFYEIVDKVGKHNVMLMAFIFAVVVITGLYSTFSIFTATDGVSVVDGVETYKFILDPTLSASSIKIPANSDKNLDVIVTNNEEMSLKYALYYSSDEEVTIGYTSLTTDFAAGVIKANSVYVVSLKVRNTTSSDITVTLGLAYGFENGGDLTLPDGASWIENYPVSMNEPNLDDGNLIPVYYDEDLEKWRKADSSNVDNSWYDYDNKKWANAVMISDDNLRGDYQVADIGTPIEESDITGFLVWVPRFKYRVWNINRQAGDEASYAYTAYTNGIDIMWEEDTMSTGNVECTYDVVVDDSVTTLSDYCVYKGIDTITTTSNNLDYRDAWYTHPAFTFEGNEKTGFWVGKFETTGISSAPTILPDEIAMVNQSVSAQFTTSKAFQGYISSNVDAHMLTNLEWGAVSYLTHSKYGLCDETTCRDAYINNSESMYTGRSAGVLAVNSSVSIDGTYDYKGYTVNDNSIERDESKVASTTGNITGVYDMVGGASENVMANMVNGDNAFNPLLAGVNWNESDTLSIFYYNPYSYGITSDNQTALNRAQLGDATAEIIGNAENKISAWQPGTKIMGIVSNFVNLDNPWFNRGGSYSSSSSSLFGFDAHDGSEKTMNSFRLSIS